MRHIVIAKEIAITLITTCFLIWHPQMIDIILFKKEI